MTQLTLEGFIPTPSHLVDRIIDKALKGTTLGPQNKVLVPGCGEGSFIEGLLRVFPEPTARPIITGIELNPSRFSVSCKKYSGIATIVEADFLRSELTGFDLIIGNPPYVQIKHIAETDRNYFKQTFSSAVGRFDLYFLFFEHSLKKLTSGGRLAFVTPSKYLSVHSAKGLRQTIAKYQVLSIEILPRDIFPGVLAYPCITCIQNSAPSLDSVTSVRRACGAERTLQLDGKDMNWQPVLEDSIHSEEECVELHTLCTHIGIGPATGCDSLFVRTSSTSFPSSMSEFLYKTISGAQLVPGQATFQPQDLMLIPYIRSTSNLAAGHSDEITKALLNIDPVTTNKRIQAVKAKKKHTRGGRSDHCWFRFKDSINLDRLLSPKILVKDITEKPEFWVDSIGDIIPRHTVYYIILDSDYSLEELFAFLQSDFACAWLKANSQKASGGCIRVQASVLKRMPVPLSWVGRIKGTLTTEAVA